MAAVSAVIAVAAALTLVAATLGQSAQLGLPRQGITGVVTVYDGTALVVEKANGESVTIIVDIGTVILAPGAEGVAGELEAGAQVAVLVELAPESVPRAIEIVVKPVSELNQPVTGAVADFQDGVITILRPDGTLIMVTRPANAPPFETGQVVTVFARRAGGPDGSPVIGSGMMTADQVRDRLRDQLRTMMDDDADRTQTQDRLRTQLLTRLAAALETHEQTRLRLLEQLKTHTKGVPVAAQLAVQSRLQSATQAQAQVSAEVQAAIQKANELGPGGPPAGTPGQGGSPTTTPG